MKPARSNQKTITLALAGALAAGMVGCDDGRRRTGGREVKNGEYVTDLGYYHSDSGGWYPYPFNHYAPGTGYYGGARGWSSAPYASSGIRTTSSVPVPIPLYHRPIAPTPGITPPIAPTVSNYSYNPTTRSVAPSNSYVSNSTVSRSTSSPVSSPSKATSTPSSTSSGSRIGGFGSSAGSSNSSAS